MLLLADSSEPAMRTASQLNAPLAVSVKPVSPLAAASFGGPSWVFDAEPSQLPLPSSSRKSLRRWAREHDGVPASGNYVEVVLHALGPRSVIVDRLRVVVTRRRRASTGTAVFVAAEPGALVPPFLVADLDRTPIVVHATPGIDAGGGRIPEVMLPHVVSNVAAEAWRIQAQTASYDCDWVAYLDWRSAGASGSIRLDNRGEPFRTAGIRRATWVSAARDSTDWSSL